LRTAVAAAVLALGLAMIGCAPTEPPVLSHTDLKPTTARADARIPYGSEPSQFVELWRPEGPGPHPVVAVLHGGCWQAQIAGLDIMDPAAADLRRRGYAVWNAEYRRLGEPGGGYPGAFQDVGAALDALRTAAPAHSLDLNRLVVIGHSAGGHLAQWAATRPALPEGSPLRTAAPLPIPAVISLGGLGDLEASAADPTATRACGDDTIARLIGAAERPGDAYADTSPARLPAPGVRQVLIHGEREQIAPVGLAQAYAARAKARGETVEIRTVPGGHFEPITPGTPAWEAVLAEIARLT
jgi:acetyl esterase/lipase